MHKHSIKEIMSTDLITVNPDDNILYAYELLRDNRIRQLPVCNNGTIIGIITDRDIRQALGMNYCGCIKTEINKEDAECKRIKDYMTTNITTITTETPIEAAVTLIKNKKIGSLPVCNKENKLIGIITITDISCLLITLLEEKS